MGAFKNLIGKKFGRLTVISRAENNGKKVMWNCRCDCGNEVIVWSSDLCTGAKKSCGCLLDDWRKEKIEALIGARFGRITVIGFIPKEERENPKKSCLCKCDCGKIFPCRPDLIKSGRRVSCGCYNREISKAGITKKHGKYQTRIYSIWHKMKERCLNKNVHEFPRYGGEELQFAMNGLGKADSKIFMTGQYRMDILIN